MSEDSSSDEETRIFAKSNKPGTSRYVYKFKSSDEETETSSRPLLRGLSRIPSSLKIGRSFRRFKTSCRRLNCFKNEDEEIPMIEAPRQKSFDIGIARRVSLFLFTKRTVCVHPYHPYTPEQTTRKLFFCFDDKHVDKKACRQASNLTE